MRALIWPKYGPTRYEITTGALARLSQPIAWAVALFGQQGGSGPDRSGMGGKNILVLHPATTAKESLPATFCSKPQTNMKLPVFFAARLPRGWSQPCENITSGLKIYLFEIAAEPGHQLSFNHV